MITKRHKRQDFSDFMTYYEAWRKYDLFMGFFAGMGLLVQLVGYEYQLAHQNESGFKRNGILYEDPMLAPNMDS